jgi:hypothetical protein
MGAVEQPTMRVIFKQTLGELARLLLQPRPRLPMEDRKGFWTRFSQYTM